MSSDPHRRMAFTTSVFCTSTRTPTDGSTADSASTASTAWKKRAPPPPYCSGISMPMTPRSNSFASSSFGNFACSSISRASGRICASANSATLSRSRTSSSARLVRAGRVSGCSTVNSWEWAGSRAAVRRLMLSSNHGQPLPVRARGGFRGRPRPRRRCLRRPAGGAAGAAHTSGWPARGPSRARRRARTAAAAAGVPRGRQRGPCGRHRHGQERHSRQRPDGGRFRSAGRREAPGDRSLQAGQLGRQRRARRRTRSSHQVGLRPGARSRARRCPAVRHLPGRLPRAPHQRDADAGGAEPVHQDAAGAARHGGGDVRR